MQFASVALPRTWRPGPAANALGAGGNYGVEGVRKFYSSIYSAGGPERYRILVCIPPIVGSVVCIGTIIWGGASSNMDISGRDWAGWAGWAGLGWAGWLVSLTDIIYTLRKSERERVRAGASASIASGIAITGGTQQSVLRVVAPGNIRTGAGRASYSIEKDP